MRMRRGRILTAAGVAALAVSALTADAVLAVPASTSPPKLVGDVSFMQTISCDPGTWSGAPTSYSYAWYVGGAPHGTGQKFTLDQPFYMGGYYLTCTVTATDGAGATASASTPPVMPALGRTKLTITKVTTKSGGRVTFKGKLTPRIASSATYAGGEVVLHRDAKQYGAKAVFQLGGPVTLSHKGTFTINGVDKPGKRTIRVDYYPGHAGFGLWAPASATRKVKILGGKAPAGSGGPGYNVGIG
jgi:hypothetical protein